VRRVSSLQWKFGVSALVIAVLIFFGQALLHPLSDAGLTATDPITKSFGRLQGGVGDFINSFVLAEQLLRENKQLKSQVAQDQSRLAQLNEVQNENTSLRKQLKLLPTLNNPVVAASVVGHDPSNLLEYVVIDKGSSDGIAEGNAVLSDGVLVGQCESVSSHSSRVLLLSDPHSAVDATVQSSRASGIVGGTLGFGLSISQVPQNETISNGDTIITSGLGSAIPKGLLIGTVSSISSSQNDIFQTARIVSPVNFSKLETVYVVTPRSR
jgi:rod shape-determining protein MreC